MTQDYAVQNQGPSPFVRAALGTGVGALGGWGISKIPALQGAKYSSWDDVLKDSKDLFTKTKAAVKDDSKLKGVMDDVVKAYNTYGETVRTVNKEARNALTTEKQTLADAVAARKSALDKVRKDVFDKIKANDIKIEGFDPAGKADDVITKEVDKYIRNVKNESAEVLKPLKEAASKVTEAKKALNNAKKLTDAQKTKITEAATSAWDSVKDKVKDLKAPKTLLCVGGAAAAGLVLGLLLKPKAKEQA